MNIQTSLDVGAGSLILPQPYLLFLGDTTERGYAKTAFGLRDWAPEKCVGEYALAGATVSAGLEQLTPAQAHASGARSLLIGVATGLLWAPCAGPILGLVLTGAALQRASIGTTLLLLAYAAGAATSLGAGEWLRRGLGALMLGPGAQSSPSNSSTPTCRRMPSPLVNPECLP